MNNDTYEEFIKEFPGVDEKFVQKPLDLKN